MTVDEVVLLPGDDAIIAPPWVPWRDRIQPGDLSPGDLLPDRRGRPAAGADVLHRRATRRLTRSSVVDELGLGRSRVLSLEGRELAAQRWYDGDQGPDVPLAQSAPGRCAGCGFLVRLDRPAVDDVRRLRQRVRQRRRPGGLAQPRLRRPLRGPAAQEAAAAAAARTTSSTRSASTTTRSSEPGPAQSVRAPTTSYVAIAKSPLRPSSTSFRLCRRGNSGRPAPSVTGAIETTTWSSSPRSAN